MQKYVTEAIGTFFLVLAIQTTGNPLAIGGMLMVMVYMGGHISGAHYNPAVTLAVFLRGKLPSKEIVPYWIFQLTGGMCGALVGWLLIRNTGTPAPPANDLWFHAIVAETVLTFALALVILNVATNEKTEGNSYYGLAIGFTVMAGAYVAGRSGGSAFNPAVGLSLHLTDLFNANNTSKIQWFWIPLIFPFIGGALAAFVYQFQHTGSFSAPGATELQEKLDAAKAAKAESAGASDSSDASDDESGDDAKEESANDSGNSTDSKSE